MVYSITPMTLARDAASPSEALVSWLVKLVMCVMPLLVCPLAEFSFARSLSVPLVACPYGQEDFYSF